MATGVVTFDARFGGKVCAEMNSKCMLVPRFWEDVSDPNLLVLVQTSIAT